MGDVQKICEALGESPAEELIKMLREEITLAYCPHCKEAIEFADVQGKMRVPMLTAAERVKVRTELLQFLAPKLRATEIKGEVNHNFSIEIVQFGGGQSTEKSIPVKAVQEITDGDSKATSAA